MPRRGVRIGMADPDGRDAAFPRGPRVLAPLAFLLLVTSVWLPWWGVRNEVAGEGRTAVAVRLFQDHPEVVHGLTLTSGVLVAAGVLLLFVRTAGKSWHYEPRSYRRDLFVAFGLVAAGLLLTVYWPEAHGFWSTRAYEVEADNGTLVYYEKALPLGGWWIAAVGAVCVGAAAVWAYVARPRAH